MKFHNSIHADTNHPEEKLDVAQDGDKPGGNKRLDLNMEPWFEMQLLAFQQLPVLSYEFSVHVFRFTKSPAVTRLGKWLNSMDVPRVISEHWPRKRLGLSDCLLPILVLLFLRFWRWICIKFLRSQIWKSLKRFFCSNQVQFAKQFLEGNMIIQSNFRCTFWKGKKLVVVGHFLLWVFRSTLISLAPDSSDLSIKITQFKNFF